MLNSARLLSPQLCSYSLPNHIIQKASGVRFTQAVSGKNHLKTSDKMDQENEQKSGSGDDDKSLSGGGYAKRSDEAGYGAVYGGNQSLSKEDEDKIVFGNAPEHDKSERSS